MLFQVGDQLVAASEIQAVDVVKIPQLCSATLNKHQDAMQRKCNTNILQMVYENPTFIIFRFFNFLLVSTFRTVLLKIWNNTCNTFNIIFTGFSFTD